MMIAALSLLAALAAGGTISGVVHDPSGAVVPGASVVVRAGSGPEHRSTTGPDGRFTIDAPETGQLTVIVRAGGFAEKAEQVPATQEQHTTTQEQYPTTTSPFDAFERQPSPPSDPGPLRGPS